MKLRSMIEWCTLLALQEGFLFDVPRLFSCTVDLWAHWYACPSVSPPCFSYSTALSAAEVYCSAPDSAYCGSDGGEKKKKKKVQKKINIITDRNYSNTNIYRLIIKIYDYGWFHVSKTTNVKFNNFELIIQNIVLFFVFNFIHYYTFIKIIHFVCYLNDYCYKLTFT